MIGAEGDFEVFGNRAQWDVYGQYGRADLREQLRNIMQTGAPNGGRLGNATNVAFAPGRQSRRLCGRLDPVPDQPRCQSRPTTIPPACRSTASASASPAPAAIDYVLGDPYRDQVVEQTVVGANLSFTPFATWAGDVSIAVGGEYREERIDGFVPHRIPADRRRRPATTNLWSVGNYLPSHGSFNVKEAYLEAVVPLGFGLEFNGAVRATDYSTSGYVTTWRARRDLAADRGHPAPRHALARHPRAQPQRAVRGRHREHRLGAATRSSMPTGIATPLNGVVYNTASISYSGLATGNPNLRPEKADSWNIGGVISPRFLPGFSASVDYFRIDLDGAIDSLSAQNIINLCFQGRRMLAPPSPRIPPIRPAS